MVIQPPYILRLIRECSARLFDFLVASDEENEHDADDDALNNVDGGVENVGFHLKPPVDIPEKRLGAVCISSLMRSRRLFLVSRRMLSTSGSGITSWMRLPTNRLAISDCGSEKTWMTEPVSTTLPKSMTATLLQISG